MKKLFLTLAMALVAMVSFAYDVEVDGIYYSINQNTKIADVEIGPSGYSGSVIIPETITVNGTNYSVKGIHGKAFEGCTGLTSVTIPNSVIGIGLQAFSGCTGLTSIDIPNSVTYISDDAFLDCAGLISVTIGNSVTSIGNGTFQRCNGLKSINIPNSVSVIKDNAFLDCSGLTSVIIPNSVTSIGDNAFSGCSGLTSFVVDSDNQNYCSEDNMLFNKDKTELLYCMTSKKVINNIPNSVTSIANWACYNSDLTSIEIPNSVTSIGFFAFSECSDLTSIEIPNSVMSIGKCAFAESTGLTSVTIGNAVTSIGYGAFDLCSGLSSISVGSENSTYDSRENCNAIIETSSNTLIYGCQNTIIPYSVTSIGEWAFYNCLGLTSVTIPNSVTNIGSDAFEDCTGLTSVTIPNSVTNVGYSVFDGCTNLKNVTVAWEAPLNVSFYGCPLGNATLHVPASTIEAYSSADVWKDFGTIESIKVNTNPSHFATYSAGFDWKVATPGVKAYKASVTGTTITLTELDGYIPAGEGVFLSGDVASIEIDVKGTASRADVSGNDLKGTTLSSGLLAEMPADKFVFALGSGNEFLHYTGSAFVHNRAYFEFDTDPTAAGAKMTLVFEDNESTGISEVNGEMSPVHGKYLKNGEIIIVKNGQKYNVNGQVIK